MQTNVFESMYAKLLNGALQAIDILSTAKSEQDLRVLCCLKHAIKQAESTFYEQAEGEGKRRPRHSKKAAPQGGPALDGRHKQ